MTVILFMDLPVVFSNKATLRATFYGDKMDLSKFRIVFRMQSLIKGIIIYLVFVFYIPRFSLIIKQIFRQF